MSEPTSANHTPAAASTKAVAPSPPLEGKALEMAERANRGEALSGASGGAGRGWLLLIVGILWLGLALWHASYGPARGIVATGLLYFGAILLALMWLGTLMVLAARKRKPAVVLLAPIPIVLGTWALLPWSHWLFGARVRAADAPLRAVAAEHAWIAEEAPRPLDRSIGGMHFSHIDRTQNVVRLIVNRSADGRFEGGLMFVPAGSVPRAPGGAEFTVQRAVTAEWFEYALRR